MPPLDTAEFDSELAQMIRALWNVPSIIMWEPFNESQSQHDTPKLVEMIKTLDPSRLVDEASGGGYTGHGDVYDLHSYPPPGCPKPNATEALACGEYGGVALNVPGHTWTGKGGGYINAADPAVLLERYDEYAAMLRGFRDYQGLSAAVYTQLTDVETEINGLMTYDRESKVEPAKLVAANHLEYLPPTYKPVLPTSETTAQTWKYTTAEPAVGWEKAAFDDEGWNEGPAAFGKQEAIVGRTPWNTDNIWLRKHFNPGTLSADELQRLKAAHLPRRRRAGVHQWGARVLAGRLHQRLRIPALEQRRAEGSGFRRRQRHCHPLPAEDRRAVHRRGHLRARFAEEIVRRHGSSRREG